MTNGAGMGVPFNHLHAGQKPGIVDGGGQLADAATGDILQQTGCGDDRRSPVAFAGVTGPDQFVKAEGLAWGNDNLIQVTGGCGGVVALLGGAELQGGAEAAPEVSEGRVSSQGWLAGDQSQQEQTGCK